MRHLQQRLRVATLSLFGALFAALFATFLTGCTGSNEPATAEATTAPSDATARSSPTASTSSATSTNTAAPVAKDVEGIVANSIQPLDAAKNGSAFQHFDGDGKQLVAAGLAYENSVAFNTVWQGTALKALTSTRVGDDDFAIEDVGQTLDGALVLGSLKLGTVGSAKLVSAAGNVEAVDVAAQLGTGRFLRLYDISPERGFIALWGADAAKSLVWSADGRTWKKLSFIDVASFESVHVVSIDDAFLAVGTSGDRLGTSGVEEQIVKSFTFTTDQKVADIPGLTPKSLENETMESGIGGPIFASGFNSKDLKLWRYSNGAWKVTKASFKSQAVDVPDRSLEQLTSNADGWYGIGWAGEFRRLWHSSDGVAWKTVGAPGEGGIREDSIVSIFDSPEGAVFALDQVWFSLRGGGLERVIDDARPSATLDHSHAVTYSNDQWSLAVASRSGSSSNDRQTQIYTLDESGVGVTPVENFSTTQLPLQDSAEGASFVLTELLGPGTDPFQAKTDDSFVVAKGGEGESQSWIRLENSSLRAQGADRILYDVYGSVTPTFRFMFGWAERNGKQDWEMVIRPHNGSAFRVKSALAAKGGFSFANFNDNVILFAASEDTVTIETYSEKGLVSTQTLPTPGANGKFPMSAYHVDRSELILDAKERLTFTQSGNEYVAAPSSKWLLPDDKLIVKAHWSSRLADVDAITRTSSGRARSVELYVNGLSTGTFPLSVEGWTDAYELELLDVNRTEIRFVAIHDGVVSIVSAPTPTKASRALETAKPRS
jgi:hypothetical protein